MKLLSTYTEHEGVHMSRNGHAAYTRGERPGCLIAEGDVWVETVPHHIARLKPTIRQEYTRELVMFYRKP